MPLFYKSQYLAEPTISKTKDNGGASHRGESAALRMARPVFL